MIIWNKTKIIATIGPSSSKEKILRSIIDAGADVFRINGAHSKNEEIRSTISKIRKVSKRAKIPVAILLDLPGPKLRIGTLKREVSFLKANTTVTLDCGKAVQTGKEIPVTFKRLSKGLRPGLKIFLNDGIIELKVLKIRGNLIKCRVVSGGEIRSHKGINLPNAKLDVPSLSKRDKELLELAIHEDVDYIGLSFVRNAGNILALKKILLRRAPGIHVIAKIEKPEALTDLDNIIRASDAVMIARGDLGIEIPLFRIPSIQKDILSRCHRSGKPAITATQMLESMIEAQSPTRAEVTDVANAVWEGSDAIMLSAETSIGKYPARAVEAMSKIAIEAEKDMQKQPDENIDINERFFRASAISRAAGLIAENLNARAIVTPTRSGTTALLVSKQRPTAQIIAPTEDEMIARRMCLYWGVQPLIMKTFATVDELLRSAEKISLRSGLIKTGDTIVITSGAHGRKGGSTRIVEVRRAGERSVTK